MVGKSEPEVDWAVSSTLHNLLCSWAFKLPNGKWCNQSSLWIICAFCNIFSQSWHCQHTALDLGRDLEWINQTYFKKFNHKQKTRLRTVQSVKVWILKLHIVLTSTTSVSKATVYYALLHSVLVPFSKWQPWLLQFHGLVFSSQAMNSTVPLGIEIQTPRWIPGRQKMREKKIVMVFSRLSDPQEGVHTSKWCLPDLINTLIQYRSQR